MKAALIVNTILCALGFVPSFGLQLALVMGGGNSGTGLGSFIAFAGLIFPALPVVSVIGSWLAYKFHLDWLTLGFIALPWAALVVLLAASAIVIAAG